ncbi:hypothetical protein DK846_03440 [Methanospirillum lacunae]|uniref:Uncharacterized protein n=1 Tax=Methanospirillum lacunae TaxID=668570 RepID=A0A2V2N985_9EURY|nr:hypothetical protein DK846_03440 [Methanospirillum lacunae]
MSAYSIHWNDHRSLDWEGLWYNQATRDILTIETNQVFNNLKVSDISFSEKTDCICRSSNS